MNSNIFCKSLTQHVHVPVPRHWSLNCVVFIAQTCALASGLVGAWEVPRHSGKVRGKWGPREQNKSIKGINKLGRCCSCRSVSMNLRRECHGRVAVGVYIDINMIMRCIWDLRGQRDADCSSSDIVRTTRHMRHDIEGLLGLSDVWKEILYCPLSLPVNPSSRRPFVPG